MTASTSPISAELTELADALARAEEQRVAIDPVTASLSVLSTDDAYAIQRINIDRRLAAGEVAIGHKIGLTSLAMQQQLGVDQPDFGVVTDRMVIPNGGVIDSGALIAPRIEAEFAFRFSRDVNADDGPQMLESAIDGIAISLEIIDSRIRDWRITLADTVADNASSARIVCAEFQRVDPVRLAHLPDTIITLFQDGAPVAEGPGSAVLGNPLTSLRWLLRSIGQYGQGFHAGDVVLAGAVAAAVPLIPGTIWEAHADGFPPVRLQSLPEGH